MSSSLHEELQAIITGLKLARRSLGNESLVETDEFWLRIEQCACRVAELDHLERDGVWPVMLALLDELERTVAAFDAEHRQLGVKLRSADRRMAAGAAYRKAEAG